MLKSLRNFTTTVKWSKLARFKGLLSSLHTTFTKFDENFALYKDDIIKKVAKTETAFNEVTSEEGIETPDYEYNDKWAEEQFTKFVETRDLLEDVLDAANKPATEEKSVDAELAVDSVRAEFKSLESSVAKLESEIGSYQDGGCLLAL